MDERTTPIALPQQRGRVTVRLGGLTEDLDALHEGDPLWWGKEFVADRIRSLPTDIPLMMLIAELDGEPVADAFIMGRGVMPKGYAMSGVYVRPGERGRGVGAVVVEALADATRAYGLPGFADSVYATDEESLAAANRLGYTVMGHHRESVLDLDLLDESVAQACVEHAEQAGFVLRQLPEDADESAWHEIHDLVVETWADAPDSEGSEEALPYSVFRGFLPDSSNLLTAWRDGLVVGMTSVVDRAKDNALNTWFTGVQRAARGAGLSTALKAQQALIMRERGHHRIYTQNMDQNAAILAANERLGFTVEPGYYVVGRPVG